MVRKSILLILISIVCSPIYPQLTPQQGAKGKYGFVDEAGKFVIKAEYDEVGSFSDGIAWVLKGGKYGYVNEMGKIVVKPKYSSVGTFNEFDLCKVSIGGALDKKTGELKGAKYGFIDKNAREIVAPKYTEMGAFDSNGVCWVNVGGKNDKKTNVFKGGKYGYLLTSGVELTKLEYTDVRKSFVNGYAWVAKANKYGYIDIKGRRITDVKYDAVQDSFHNDMAGVKLKKRLGFVSVTGKETPIKYVYIGDFEHGCAVVAVEKPKALPQYGYINAAGKEFIAPIYEDVQERFHEGFAAVKQNGKWAIVNTEGEALTGFDYNIIRGFENGLAAVSKEGSVTVGVETGAVWALINTSGQLLTPFKYLYIGGTDKDSGLKMVGTIPAKTGGEKWTEVKRERKLNWVGSMYSENQNFTTMNKQITNEATYIQVKRNIFIGACLGTSYWKNVSKQTQSPGIQIAPSTTSPAGFGWVNHKGTEVIPLTYKEAQEFSDGLAAVKTDITEGFKWINAKNEVVLKTDYANTTGFSDGVAAVYDNNSSKWGCINKEGNIVVPMVVNNVDEAREIVKAFYLPTKKEVTLRQIKLFNFDKYHLQDKYNINAVIPEEMWDF